MWLLASFGCACAENLGVELEASLFKPLHKLGPEAARHECAATHMAWAYTALIGSLVNENILQCHLFTFHALHLGDLDNLAAAILETALLDNQMHGTGNLATDHAQGQAHAGHQGQCFEATYAVTRRVGVNGCQRAVVSGIHGL